METEPLDYFLTMTSTSEMTGGSYDGRKRQNCGFRILLGCLWTKKPFQYIEQVNSHEEAPKDVDEKETQSVLNETVLTDDAALPPHTLYFNVQESTTRQSFHEEDSIESMDSLVDSTTCEVEDEEISQVTTKISNILAQEQTLMAHIQFLSESTQPQEVDLMYHTGFVESV